MPAAGLFEDLIAPPMASRREASSSLAQGEAAFFDDLIPRAPGKFETQLPPDEERRFQAWKQKIAPNDSGDDYDLRGAFKAGVQPDSRTGHWPDTFKKPNHPTFSDQSIYAKDAPQLAGHWEDGKFIGPGDASLGDPSEHFTEPRTMAELLETNYSGPISKNIHVPTMENTGAVPAPLIEGAFRYLNPGGWVQLLAEKIAPENTGTKIGKGVIAGASEALAGFTTPENLATLAAMPTGKIAQILLNLGFGVEAISNLPDQIKAYGSTTDPEEKARIATGVTVALGLPALGLTHALRGPRDGAETSRTRLPTQPAEVTGFDDLIPDTRTGPAASSPEANRPSSAVDSAEARQAEYERMSANLDRLNQDQFLPSPQPDTQTQVEGFPVQRVPTAEIASRPELMQFKQMDNTATGENAADQITAPYDPIKAGNLLLWEPANPNEYGLEPGQRYIVANGHHRDAAAKGQGVNEQNAQIIREAAGYSAGDARGLAAEANIADGKGTVYDQARFIREQAASGGPDAALARARLIGARSRTAAAIGIEAAPDLYASFVNEQITPEATAAIALAAPRDSGLQRLGIQRALKGEDPQQIQNFLQAVKARTGPQPTAEQIDLFAADDAAIRAAEQASRRASTIQREIGEQINAVAGAARRPEKARALGVDVTDPASVNAKLAKLQALRERARNWVSDPEIRDTAIAGYDSPGDVIARLQETEPAPSGPKIEFRGGDYGGFTELRRPPLESTTRPEIATEVSDLPTLTKRLARRTDFVTQNREALAREIQKAATDEAIIRSGIKSQRGRDYARDLASTYADAARGGVIPQQLRLPLYRGDFEALRADYNRAAQYAYDAVHNGLRKLGFNPPSDIYAMGGGGRPRLRSAEKKTGELFQGADQPFNLAGEEAIDLAARKARADAEAAKLKAAAAAQEDQQTRLFAQGASQPGQSGAARPQPTVANIAAALPPARIAIAPMLSWWQQKTVGIRKVVAPQTIDLHARRVANIIRDYNGRQANALAQADAELAKWRASFDRTPVARNWKYVPGEALPRNYAFMAESEKGGTGLTPNERMLKAAIDRMFKEVVDEVHRVKPEALKSLIQDYFPHLWKDPEAAQRAMAAILGDRRLEGSKAFLRQRVLAYIEEGLKLGLRPLSDNPIDMVLTKLHEVRRFVAAQDILREAKEIGARKFVYIFEQPPEGWRKVDDPTSTVQAPPFVTVPEAFDEQMRVKTLEVLDSLGISNERVKSLGGKRWGTYETHGGGIRTKFAGPLSVYWHELGHGLQERYRWIDHIVGDVNPASRHPLAVELRRLADLRFEGQDPTKLFRKYVRTIDEKAAVMLEAYLHAPDKMQSVAPTIYARVKQFIADRPELHAINEIRPSLALGSSKQRIDLGGPVLLGHYYMPEGAAAVLRNYLSPGLQQFGAFRNLRTMSNVLNAAQLGFSAFHAGFTSIDAVVSTWALGLRYLSQGKVMRGARRIATAPLAPVANYFTGKAVQNAMLMPGNNELKILGFTHRLSAEGQWHVDEIAKLAVQSGLRATVDPFWRTQITRNMLRGWHEGGVKGYAGTVLRLPFAISEQLMRPVLEVLVPRQKLGVFAGMAREVMERLGPNAEVHTMRDALARAADATEDRMGQLTYDNLFYNRAVKDVALVSFRAYGWTYGKYRALLGGIADAINTPARIRDGEPVLTDRIAYLLALPMVAAGIGSMMNYAMTGQAPQDWKDLFMPRTGKFDANGNPQRLSPPTYIKDFLSDWHDAPNLKKMLGSFYHKLNPWISVAVDILRNSDFYRTEIYNEDDPWLKQQADKVTHVLKSALPFSVTGAQRLSESGSSGAADYILPFFGFVQAKAALTMTPAQNRAIELFRDSLPAGARTQAQSDHSRLLAQIIRDLKSQDPEGVISGPQEGQLRPGDLKRIMSGVRVTPFQYQVMRLSLPNAMRVWDLANTAEREQLRLIILKKFHTTKTVPLPEKLEYWRAFTNGDSRPR
jgi:hypothetical protein